MSRRPPRFKLRQAPSARVPLKSLATVFVLLVCFSLIGISGWLSWTSKQTKLLDAEKTTSNLTRALSQQADDTFGKVDVVLASLTQRYESAHTLPGEYSLFVPWMQSLLSPLPELESLFLFDQNGRAMLGSADDSDVHSQADPEYFTYHKNNADRASHISAPVQAGFNGEWLLPVTRRLNHADGSFAGIAAGFIKLSYFSNYYNSFDIGSGGVILLALDTGEVILRKPAAKGSTASDLAQNPLLASHLHPGDGNTYAAVSSSDGVDRLLSYRHLDRYPVVVVAGLSREEFLSVWRSETLHQTIALSLLSVLLALLGLRLISQIQKRGVVEKELRAARASLLAMNETLEKLALQDGLTGLANRRQFDTALQKEFQRAMRFETPLALIMIDVDHFKRYNDIYGHPAGDQCLRSVGNVIKTHRPGDLGTRYGGEEFAILLPATDLAGAMQVAETIRKGILELHIAHKGNPPANVVSASFGVHAVTPKRGGSGRPIHLLQYADRALYAAKGNGRNRVCSVADSVEPEPLKLVGGDRK